MAELLFRNLLRNPSFAINQRGVSGSVVLTANSYGHDGVKAGAAGATYTFATIGLDTILTITAGSLILPIESTMIEGGSYALCHEGTALARIWQGTGSTGSGVYQRADHSAPLGIVGLTVNTQTNVEFGMGTVLRPQFEQGSYATQFVRRARGVELVLCQHYFQIYTINNGVVFGIPNYYGVAGSYTVKDFLFSPMYATPTATLLGVWPATNIAGAGLAIGSNAVGYWFAAPTTTGVMSYTNPIGGGFKLEADL
jgi:hypothetical protein